jgi:predicted house-cleaning NTP pyrophosphatase (Maf/HAM1 superfamily)
MAYGNRLITNTSVTEIEYIEFDRATITKLLESDDATIRNSGLGFFIDAPGFTLVKSFNGSYTGAMGLPMEIVRENLTVLGYKN